MGTALGAQVGAVDEQAHASDGQANQGPAHRAMPAHLRPDHSGQGHREHAVDQLDWQGRAEQHPRPFGFDQALELGVIGGDPQGVWQGQHRRAISLAAARR